MDDLTKTLKNLVQGEVVVDDESLTKFSHDASMFELKPEVIVAPKDDKDIMAVVDYVSKNKSKNQKLSVTVRSAGTCMSGGAINDSIVLDMNRHFTAIEKVSSTEAQAQPGVFYRDFEAETLKHGSIMPSYPASRELCTIGGMVANNAGGEKSLQFGKTEKFVKRLEVVLADGNKYVVEPLNKKQLDAKMKQPDFEGRLYKKVFDLVDGHYDEIKAAQPKVSKDSTGYHLWNVWDRETGIFDMTQLIVGSQGTLGIVTNVNFKLVPNPKHSGTLVVFLRSLDDLGEFIVDVMKHKPAAFEGFDNYTLMLSFKLFLFFYKQIGWLGMFKLAIQLIPDAFKLIRGIPKMVLLIEFTADTPEEVARLVRDTKDDLSKYRHEALFEEDETESKQKKFWIMRRESFNLLRQKVKDKHTAPFMDDLVVPPEVLPKFLPEVRKIINKYKLLATIAGHFGDGNFHIIPLMNIEKPKEKAKLEPAMREINDLVIKYHGSLSGEHNDGMIRGPWLEKMYGPKVYSYFKEVKHIFDPENIFNPHKKTDADWDYSMKHLRVNFD